MKSSAFDGFHLSDLEYGVRLHHDMLRLALPVMTLEEPPAEKEMAPLERGNAWNQCERRAHLIKRRINQDATNWRNDR